MLSNGIEVGGYMVTTAYLTGNRRDVNTSSPKALFINVKGFRDHCWVVINTAIEHLQPAGHQKPIKVEVVAEPVAYLKRGTEKATTLKVKEIRCIK